MKTSQKNTAQYRTHSDFHYSIYSWNYKREGGYRGMHIQRSEWGDFKENVIKE
jgi:hypothetical protein